MEDIYVKFKDVNKTTINGEIMDDVGHLQGGVNITNLQV